MYSNEEKRLTPREWRERFREGEVRPTVGLAEGFVQLHLVVLPQEQAFDFLLYCQRNPLACPLVEMLEPGTFTSQKMAPGANLGTDLPLYRIFEKGVLKGEADNIKDMWNNKMVAFLLGCGLSVDQFLLEVGIPVRHLEEGQFGSIFITNLETAAAGIFRGPIAVSMRPVAGEKVAKAVQITSRFPAFHGEPIYIGDPGFIGIQDLQKPDFGTPLTIKKGETPVFWACGVTAQLSALCGKVDFMITQAPSHMLITDIRSASMAAY
ncbi:MAG: DUF1445 domain-containing protein [Bacillota bacterium]